MQNTLTCISFRSESKSSLFTSSGRMQGLAAAAAGLTGYNTYNSLTDKAGKFDPAKAADINVSVSLGSSKSQSNSASNSNTARGSTVAAGNNVNINATGAGADSNLLIQGSNIKAANNISLAADNQVNLLAAKNESSQASTNSSSSGSVGVSVGGQTGVTLAGSKGKGKSNGADTSYTNSQISAGNTAAITSGGDTNIKGAVVEANQIKADVGTSGQGSLNMESLQDTSTYTGSQKSAGGSITIGPSGPTGGSISASKSNINSDFQSVGEQSGLKAGDGGFQVSVANNTNLTGAVIASTQKAVEGNANTFATGGQLNTTDVQNTASFSGNAVGGTIGVGSQLGSSGAGIGNTKGSSASTSSAGISGVAGNTAVRTGDAETGLQKIFDADKAQKEIDAQVKITTAFTQQAAKSVGDYADKRMKDADNKTASAEKETDPDKRAALLKEAEEIKSTWGEGKPGRVGLHAVIGALTGNLAGALGAGTSQAAIPYIANAIAELDAPLEVKQALIQLAGTAIGAATGGVSGGASALSITANNYLLHNKLKDEEGELRKLRLKKEAGQCNLQCEQSITALETLDKQRDKEIQPLVDACDQAGRKNCKAEAIAEHYALANGYGKVSMEFEGNPGTKGSPFSFNHCPASDKGGCSYGPVQIAADTGLMQEFIADLKRNPSAEAQTFYKALNDAGGVKAAQTQEKTFVDTWMKLTAQDPQFVQYQIDLLTNRNLYPVVQELAKVGVDFDKLTTAEKEMLFSSAVQHGAGTVSKTKGADNIVERALAQADGKFKAPSLPTYTRADLVYGEVEDRVLEAEKKQKAIVTEREKVVTEQKAIVTEQLELERKKNALLVRGASLADVQTVDKQVQALDKKIDLLNQKIEPLNKKAEKLSAELTEQDKYISQAYDYLKSQALESQKNGEKFITDFYANRKLMYPSEAKRYDKEMQQILQQYRREKKALPK